MDVLSLSSSSSLSISKPFQFHGLPLSSKQQRASQVQFGTVSCRAATQENLYKILSVSPGSATTDEIKRAYRSMALQYHPDVCHDPSMKEESSRMFVQLNAAYTTLSNPRLRAQYDSALGLRSKVSSVSDDHEIWGSRLQEEGIDLKTRSRRRVGQKGGSSGTRMRTQNMRDRS
ncbi:Chaperone protein DnaJ [Spatholobus suberectus]|nr:Chaperone protein DnaJ [Spatholobus suberectus]